VPTWAQTVYITIPMLSPMLLFTFITSLISAFQQLTIALLLTKGGPLNSTYFFAMYIYDNAFKFHDMGYAAAMSWVMFLTHPDPQPDRPEILGRLGALRRRSERGRQWLGR